MYMLAKLEREHLLYKHDTRFNHKTPIKNLSLIMALFMIFPGTARQYGLLENSEKDKLGLEKDKRDYSPHAFDDHIYAYARKYKIELVGPHNITEYIANADGNAELVPMPSSNHASKSDPFGFARTLTAYKKKCGGITGFMVHKKGKTVIGGDLLDITTWTSAERKRKSNDDTDPLGKEVIDDIKNGMVLGRGG